MLPKLTIGLISGFLALLVVLHFLEPEFDPSWRMISEYAIGRYGILMNLAFFCWGGAVLTLSETLRPVRLTTPARVWMGLIGAALFGAGIFTADPITIAVNTPTGKLHTLCGVIVILTFPGMATLVSRQLAAQPAWAAAQAPLRWMARLTMLGLVCFFVSIIVSRQLHPNAGRVGPEILMGWPNRFMVLTYCLWLATVAKVAHRHV